MNLGRNITYECLLSQSIRVLSGFKSSYIVCLKKLFNGGILLYHLKDTEKTVKGLI